VTVTVTVPVTVTVTVTVTVPKHEWLMTEAKPGDEQAGAGNGIKKPPRASVLKGEAMTDLAADVREAFCVGFCGESKPNAACLDCIMGVANPESVLAACKRLLSRERLGEEEIRPEALKHVLGDDVSGLYDGTVDGFEVGYKAAQDRILGPVEGCGK